MLGKILVRDPQKRITIEGIQNHSWYSKNLPPGVKEMNNNLRVSDEGLQVCESIKYCWEGVKVGELVIGSSL